MKNNFNFTFNNIKKQYQLAINKGYKIIRCIDYIDYKKNKSKEKIIVNRVDIDISVKKAAVLGSIFREFGIKASFFIRLHAPEYNPFSFENYRIIKELIQEGHEIGYHSEVVDQSVIWNENPEKNLKRDIDVINRILNIEIKGVTSHGGMTELNNLDFWKNRNPSDFGLLYEGYDKSPEFNLFNESFYISDSEWIRWKCYDKGKLRKGDFRSFGEHVKDDHPLIYLLIHSDTYFYNHFYE